MRNVVEVQNMRKTPFVETYLEGYLDKLHEQCNDIERARMNIRYVGGTLSHGGPLFETRLSLFLPHESPVIVKEAGDSVLTTSKKAVETARKILRRRRSIEISKRARSA